MSEYYWKTNEVCFAVLQDAYKCNFVHQFYRKTMASFTFLSIHLKGDRTQRKQSTRDKNYLTDGEKGRRCNNNFSAKKNLLTLFQFLVLSGTNKKLFVLSGTKKKKHQQRQRHTKEILCSCPAHSQCQCLLSSSPQCDEEWKRWEGARDEKSCTKKALSGILSLSSSVWRGKGGRGGGKLFYTSVAWPLLHYQRRKRSPKLNARPQTVH